MLIAHQELEHPTQVSRLRLRLFSYEPSGHDAVAGLLPPQKGFNVIEERVSTASVVTSLGFYPTEDQARHRMDERARQLLSQGYRPAPAPQPA